MYLVDTSVWIDYFREIENGSTTKFVSILERNLPFGITGVIYQEILQGAASERDFNKLRDYLATQRFFNTRDEIVTYESAEKLFYQCRRKGITIRSSIDCFVAQIAIEHYLVLLHNYQDYNRIQTLFPELLLILSYFGSSYPKFPKKTSSPALISVSIVKKSPCKNALHWLHNYQL